MRRMRLLKAASLVAMQMHWMRDLMGEFGYRQGCVRVLEDNSATCQVAPAREQGQPQDRALPTDGRIR